MTTQLCLPVPSWLASALGETFGADPGCVDGTCDVVVVGEGGTTAARQYRTAAAVGRETLSLIQAGKLSTRVREWTTSAIETAGAAPYGDPCAVAAAVLRAAADGVAYVPDPVRAELVQGPVALLTSRAGDCEDMTALAGAALESVGVPVRVVLVRYAGTAGGPDAYDHVYPEADVSTSADPGPCWVAVDATVPGALGVPAAVGLDPSTFAPVASRLVLDPYAAPPAAPPPPTTMRRRLFGLGAFDFGSFGLPSFGSPPGGSFGYDPTGGQFGFDLGLGSGSFGLDLGGLFGGGDPFGGSGDVLGLGAGGGTGGKVQGRDWFDRALQVIETAGPLIAALFGRSEAYVQSRGGRYNPTGPVPPGYRRVVDPETGRTVDVPDALADEMGYEVARQAAAPGGISTTTVFLAVAAVGVTYFAFQKKGR